MSHIDSTEVRTQAEVVGDVPRTQVKCRIPQRQHQFKPRTMPIKRLPTEQISNVTKARHEVQIAQHNPRLQNKVPRPRSTESRPKSSSRVKDDAQSGKQLHPPRSARPADRSPVPKKPPMRKPFEAYPRMKAHIAVPLMNQRQLQKIQKLPDQETIKKFEELELRGEYANAAVDDEAEKSPLQIKMSWQDKMAQFEQMKSELDRRQKAIMELYATMRNTHKMMAAMGQQAALPSAEDLSIMNVAKLTPDQLLQLCSGPRPTEGVNFSKGPVTIDMNKLYDMPTKLVATCEQTLIKRKEIINWFETLQAEDKGISKMKLVKKIKEFYAENEMLNCSLQTCKTEFLKELNEIVDYLRKGVNESIALQLRTEELTYELSVLDSQNTDLRKQLHACDHMKFQNNRRRVEDLEKELKDEKCKKLVIKDRLTRAEGQVKIGEERAAQLEAALELARSQNWTLERTIQQLNEQNQKLQMDFDQELNNLTESIKNNTVHLEEIADAREKLQAEKEDLEKRLRELSDSYNESLGNMKEELTINITKLIDTEKKFDEEKEERQRLESKLETLCAQLLESEIRYKDVVKQLKEKDSQLTKFLSVKTELDLANHDLEAARSEVEDYRLRLMKQTDAIKEIERNFKETISLEKNLRGDLRTKEEYISELEKKQTLLEQQLHDNEQKMKAYETQLATLKSHMAELQQQFGEFENVNQLHEMLNQQRAKLLETTRQNGELAEALQKKDMQLENQLEHLGEQENLLEQRDGVIKMLTGKEEEHSNIIKLLRNSLEMRVKAETDLTQQLAEKNAEIESLTTNVDTRKKQISQLEKIILTLEDQLRKIHLQRRNDQEKMTMLEKALTDYESYHMDAKRSIEAPVDNLDNLIKILEDELGTSIESKHQSKKRYISDRLDRKKPEGDFTNSEMREPIGYQTEHDKMPTKIVMGNFVKKTYISANEERDNLDRKKAITNIDTQKWLPNPEPGNIYTMADRDSLPPFRGMVPLVQPKDQYLSRYLMSNQREEKKSKMFKLAGHRL